MHYLKKRLKQHKDGFVASTKHLRPSKLVWGCVFPTRLLARRFEKYLKTGSGQTFRNKHLM